MRVSVAQHDVSELSIDSQLFERILRLTPDVVYVYDLVSGRNVYANRQITDTLGYPVGTIRQFGNNVLQALVHPEDWASVQAHLGRMRFARDHDVVSCEYRMRHADGSWRVLLSRDQPLCRDDDGRARQILGFATDLTALRQKDRLLRQSTEQLSMLFQAIAECYIALDRDGRVLELNARAADGIGQTAEELIGRRLGEVLAADLGVVEAVEQAYASQQPQHKKIFVPRRPGRWFELNAYPAESGAGLVVRDVTDRERVERSTAEAASFLQAAIDALSTQVAIIDESGTIISANRSWIEGTSDEAESERLVVGANYLAVFPRHVSSEPSSADIGQHLRALMTGDEDSFRASYRRVRGSEERWLQVRAKRFVHFDQVRIVVAHEDITEVKERERERQNIARRLLEVQDVERRRIGRELHDSTGQTLAGIQLGLVRLRAKLGEDDGAHDIFSDLKEALTRAQSDLRVFSLLLHPPLLEDSELASVLRQFAKSFAGRTGLTIDCRCRANLHNLRQDVALTLLRITQEALANVHSHARAKSVRIRLAKKRRFLILEIEDDGIGIPRLDGPGTRARIGVGLTGMRARARELHGDLTIKRQHAGGTLIRATLPLDQLFITSE